MPLNQLLTGPPRVGKTTAIERAADTLEDRGFRLGGVTAPALRSGGERVGFRLIDLRSGESAVMAHVDSGDGPSVGKYTVDIEAVDRIASLAFERGFAAVDAVVIDEIAPMEVHSQAFTDGVVGALDAWVPLIGAIHRSDRGFFGSVKARDDVEVLTVTPDNRDALPERLATVAVQGSSRASGNI